MSNPYFGGAPNAFQGGIEFGAAQRRRKLNENALAALIERYGPEAADPAALATLQAVEQGEQLHPYAVAAAESTRNARDAMIDEYGATGADPEMHKRDLALKLAAAKRAAAVLSLTKQRKGDLGRAFDFVADALPALGIPPERMGELRESIINDPDTVDELVALLQDPESDSRKSLSSGVAMRNRQTGQLEWVIPTETGHRVIPGYTPVAAEQGDRRLAQGDTRLGLTRRKLTNDEAKMRGFNAAPGYEIWEDEEGRIEAAPIPGTDKAQEYTEKLREAEATDRKYLQAFNASRAHGTRVFESAQSALEFFSEAKSGLIMQNFRRLAPLAAGTPMHEAWRSLNEIRNNIGIDELQRMRQSSPTGGAMGNVSDRDIQLLTGALGELDTIRDPKVMVDRLNYIVKEYNRILEFARQDALAAQNRINKRETEPPRAPGRTQSEPSLDDLLNQYDPPVKP